MPNDIVNNLKKIKSEINNIADAAKRQKSDIKLLAVSKKQKATDILRAFRAGQIDFGENYIQEFNAKQDELTGHDIKWHFIGHIQRNKVKKLIGSTHLIHTLDRVPLAQTIENLCTVKNITQNCLIQVKLSKNENKEGCQPNDLFDFINDLNELSHIKICGLMTIGTLTNDLRLTRSEFKQLRELKDQINQKKIYKHNLTHLSMGMSSDFKVAIEEGATIVRIGTDIFGKRT
ncbi:YggS family pyridoxal phosphate enzyme [bacterium K02(2017)]|nr:YggS family pyridoxal phosphate enzyme [bacterium K02(2017)]